jgi:hypothetical protein
MPFKRKIFVFGSNREGRHGKGAALTAVRKHGAIRGQPSDLQGNSYAIITKELRPTHPKVTRSEVLSGVRRFKRFAARHPDWVFNLSCIGCGLAGFSPDVIAPMFRNAPDNVKLPKEFREVLDGQEKGSGTKVKT